MSAPDNNADDDDLLDFADEADSDSAEAAPVWRLLIVDDSPDVHEATMFALAGTTIEGRKIEFSHAYSAAEAKELFTKDTNFAVTLLDVVMEADDAGLQLVKVIREQLKLKDMRILLRTGQPGYAPEIQTIHDYDINDYVTKSELTRSKLYAAVTASVRAYNQIRTLADLAFYDKLSKLPNRNAFIDMIQDSLSNSGRTTNAMALVDIDDFSEINDALGYRQGDQLLQAVAERLTDAFGNSVRIARVGADIFGILGATENVEPKRMLDLFHEPFKMQDDALKVTATVGLAKLAEVGESGEDALKDANIVLKRAKKRRRGHFDVFSADMGVEIRERMRLLQGLRSAFEKESLFINFQPQVELATGRVVGAEALMRWKSEDGRMVGPDRFIPLAEYSGLIVSMGEWILRGACHELKRIMERGATDFRMSVNISMVQFQHHDFLAMLKHALQDTGVPSANLELEITESMAMEDPMLMLEILKEIKALGFSIAIDDFGTGYSSLSQLRQLPVDRLKIDRSFVQELGQSSEGSHIADMVVSLGTGLHLRVIAEGIETEAQAEALRALGCHEGQGYLYAQPMIASDLSQWLFDRGLLKPPVG